MEYTLEDAYEALLDVQSEKKKEVDHLSMQVKNNLAHNLQATVTAEELEKRQAKFYRNLAQELEKQQPTDYPVPRTEDLYAEVLNSLKKEINNMRALRDFYKKELSDIKNNMAELKKKRQALADIEKSTLEAGKHTESKSFAEEREVVRRLFQDVKTDLYEVLDCLFPDNEDLKHLLAELSQAYFKGGDDVYLDVEPHLIKYVTYLTEADIIQFHKHDKKKIKFTDLL